MFSPVSESAKDVQEYLVQHEKKELVRLLLCGSVDDGKSTLLGRLLYDTKMIDVDTLETLEKDSKVYGTTGGDFDPALLTDGLKAEREQGITIDVAYRYFSTEYRKFIVADTPGHDQYTRNMATGASTADMAIVLIDARRGVLEQTKRHSFIISLLGIRHVIVAINKMDLVDFGEERYKEIKDEYLSFSTRLSVGDVQFIPLSALKGDNVVDKSDNMPWYKGSTLLHTLNTIYVASDRNLIDLRFPVQYVNRPDLNYRGFTGTVASGIVRTGDEIMVLPSKKTSKIKSIDTFNGEIKEAFPPMSVELVLEDEIDISRGDMIVHRNNVPELKETFDAMLVWMGEEPLAPGKQYLFKHTSKLVTGAVSEVRYHIDVNTLHRKKGKALKLNEIGRCGISLTQSIAFDPYDKNRATGAFIIIDRLSNITVGAGMILDRSTGEQMSHWEEAPKGEDLKEPEDGLSVEQKAARFGQRPVTLLLTGLPGSGKTSLALALEKRLFEIGCAAVLIDGQSLRLGLSKELGFDDSGRSENVRRSAEMAKLINRAGLICICSMIAPNEEIRKKAKKVVGKDAYFVIHVAGSSEDPDPELTYEEPKKPDIEVSVVENSVESCLNQILDFLKKKNIITKY